MTQSIPASQLVSISPGVVSAGGTGLTLSGLILTNSTRVPIGQVLSFPLASAVGAYFGLGSTEYAYAQVYFAGFDGSQIKPAALLFAQYNTAAVSGYQRGGKITASLTAIKATTAAPITVVTDGVSATTANINLSAATSFSNCATIIQAALTTATSTALCTYDATSGAFVFTSATTGANSTVSITTGAFAAALNLTTATGLVTSPGAAIAVPSTFMNALVGQAQNWAAFTTTFPVGTTSGSGVGVLFAAWVASQNNRWAFVGWDTDTVPTAGGDTTSFGYLVKTTPYGGTAPLWMAADTLKAPFVLGAIASIDFSQTNGRADMAFKSQSGLTADVTDATTAANLQASGYNYYGSWSTSAQSFSFLYPGTIGGSFNYLDTFVNQIYINNALQLAFLNLLTSARSIPYNAAGYNLVRAAAQDPINAALNAGVIATGVTLSASQAAAVNAAAGFPIDATLSTRGWYLLVQPASPTVRAARGSPPCTFWYTDGGSIHQIALSSLTII